MRLLNSLRSLHSVRRSSGPYQVHRCLNAPTAFRSPLAFVFDIDGVLLRGETVLPAAKRVLKTLDGHNPFGVKIPFLLLTNGGGVSEEVRCARLSKQLEHPIRPSQYIQAHTVLKPFAHKYADSAVLVLGGEGDTVRKVAEGYGFKKAYTTLDVLAWNPSVWPFHTLSPQERASTKAVDFSKTPISAAFVFHDPRNWALDTQVLCDVLQSRGTIGGPYTTEGPAPELIFCNPDLVWRADFERPRLGQGGFRDAFLSVHKSLTGSSYPYVQYGKPSTPTYEFAERTLLDSLEKMEGHRTLPNVYMVGDNPESDIAGANAAGWSSLLVKTGVYEKALGPPLHTPTAIVEDVEAAVQWAILQEMTNAKRSGDI